MTPRENFLAMLNGERPERLPFHIELTPPVADELERRKGTRDPAVGLGSHAVLIQPDFGESPERWRQAYESLGVRLPSRHQILRVGITFGFPENAGANYHFAEHFHPLADVCTIAELEQLPWPDPADPKHYRGIAAEIQSIRDRGLVSVLNLTCTVFEDSWYLRGMDNLFADLMEGGDVSVWLLDYMTRRSVEVAKAYAAAGVDVIWLGDDVGTQKGLMVSPPFWREHLRPRLSRVIEAARSAARDEKRIMYHSDGNIEALIPELFDLGIDILNPIQSECMDVRKILTEFRDRGAFWGMIGTQSTLPLGNPQDVRAAVQHCRELAAAGTRLVCAPTHVIEPDVPWENIEALIKAVNEATFP